MDCAEQKTVGVESRGTNCYCRMRNRTRTGYKHSPAEIDTDPAHPTRIRMLFFAVAANVAHYPLGCVENRALVTGHYLHIKILTTQKEKYFETINQDFRHACRSGPGRLGDDDRGRRQRHGYGQFQQKHRSQLRTW
jgi:hypothetical protein